MKINRINSNVNFRENNTNNNTKQIKSENAILMLRDPKAAVKFQKSQEYAKKADSVDSNPLVAIGYKLYRTFNILKDNQNIQAEKKQLDQIA